MKLRKVILISILPLLFVRCGDPDVDITGVKYEEKIAVEAYLFATESVKNIKIMRNVPLGSSLDVSTLYLTPTANSVTVTINGTALQFDPGTKTYFNNGIIVKYGNTYKLYVSAVIDGKQLNTQSTTTVPQQGFKLLNNFNMGNIKYLQDQIILKFNPSPGCNVYMFTYLPVSASVTNFIYNNPYFTNISSNDVSNNIYDYMNQYDILTDLNSVTNNEYSYKVENFKMWFYGQYTITAYAGDKNFRDYVLSAPNVKEIDGNFHEPVLDLQGDGIGVFASAVKNTLIFSLVK
jgi:hypothetical protein